MEKPLRVQYLDTAAQLTSGDRDKEYGPPHVNLGDCAVLFSAYLCCKYRGQTVDEQQFILTAKDIAHLNVLQKMARTFSGVVKPDTYIDMAAYAAIAGECAQIQTEDEE